VSRGRHWLSLSSPGGAARIWRPLADRLYMAPQPFFFDGEPPRENVATLPFALPSNVQIVTLRMWERRANGEKVFLVRLAHQFGIEEDAVLSRPVEISLRQVFPTWDIKLVEERGLSAAISRKEVLRRRVAWPIEHEGRSPVPPPDEKGHHGNATLGPLQIRTFFVTVVTERIVGI